MQSRIRAYILALCLGLGWGFIPHSSAGLFDCDLLAERDVSGCDDLCELKNWKKSYLQRAKRSERNADRLYHQDPSEAKRLYHEADWYRKRAAETQDRISELEARQQ